MSEQDIVKMRAREQELSKQWKDSSEKVTVNGHQHSFDSLNRQKSFTESMFSEGEELEQYKRYRNEWFRRAHEFDPGDYPLAVCCELVSTCSLNCSMCYTISEDFQASVVGRQRMLPWRVVKAVIDECAELGVPSMLFSWRGESSLYSSKDEKGNKVDFADVLAYARKKGILEITSLTNGQTVDENMAKRIVDADPSWISLSIDGLESAYNKIRTPVHKQDTDYNAFTQVMKTIKNIIKYRDLKGSTRPQIRTNTIFPPISDDPYAYHDFMEKAGVDWITVNELMDFRGTELPEDSILDNWSCQYPFQRLTVSANGSILPCTGAHNEEKEMLLGLYPGSRDKEITVNGKSRVVKQPEMTLKDAWGSEPIKQLRELHKNNKRLKVSACKHCRHGAVKKGVDWMPEEWDMEKMEWLGREWKE